MVASHDNAMEMRMKTGRIPSGNHAAETTMTSNKNREAGGSTVSHDDTTIVAALNSASDVVGLNDLSGPAVSAVQTDNEDT